MFARALNVSEKELFKMMERGELIASEVLPKVSKEFAKSARSGGALGMMLNTNEKAMQRMKNEFTKFKKALFDTRFNAATVRFYETLIDSMKVLTPLMKGLGNFLGGLVDGFTLLWKVIVTVTRKITELANIKLPDWLTEGSGMLVYLTGFAVGIWGIVAAVTALNTAIKALVSSRVVQMAIGLLAGLSAPVLAGIAGATALGGGGYLMYEKMQNEGVFNNTPRVGASSIPTSQSSTTKAQVDLEFNTDKLDDFVTVRVSKGFDSAASDLMDGSPS